MGIMKRRKRAVELRAGVAMHAHPTAEMVRAHSVADVADTMVPVKAKAKAKAKGKVK